MSHIVDDEQAVDDEAADDERLLGERLQRLRTDRRWSLTELAEESGVSRAMINRVERGVSSPTASILGRLSGAFGMTISQLLEGRSDGGQSHEGQSDGGRTHDGTEHGSPDDRTGVQRGATAAHWTDPDTGYRRRPVSSAAFPVDVTEVVLPAGAHVTYPASAYAFLRHCIWVVDGELRLDVGREPIALGAGDRIELGEPAEVTYRNDADGPCRYVVVVARGAHGRE